MKAIAPLTIALALAFASPALADGSAAELYEQAIKLQDERKLEEAAKLYRTLLEAHGDSALAPRAALGLARAQLTLGRREQAKKLIDDAKTRYASTPGFVDQADALLIHLTMGKKRKGKGKKAGKSPRARLERKAQELKQRLAKSEAAGREQEAAELKRQLERLVKRLKAGAAGGMSRMGAAPKSAKSDALRHQQEELIERAHKLEDEGKEQEAFALRRQADELATKIDALRKKPQRRPGKGGKKAREKQRLMIERRLAKLGEQLKAVDQKLAKAEQDKQPELAQELRQVKQRLQREISQLQRTAKGGKRNKAARKLRLAERELRQLLKRQKKDGGLDEAAKAQLNAAKARVLKLREQATAGRKAERGKQLERLAERFRSQGMAENIIAERVAFMKAEYERGQAFNRELSQLRKRLTQEGQAEPTVAKELKSKRRTYSQEAVARRQAFNRSLQQRLAEQRKQATAEALAKRLEEVAAKKRSEGASPEQLKAAVDAARKNFQSERAERLKKSASKREQAAQSKRHRTLEKHLAKMRKRLTKKGAAPAEIEQRLAQLRRRYEGGRLATKTGGKGKKNKGQGGENRRALSQKVARLQRELQELKGLVRQLLAAQRRARSTPAPEAPETTPAEPSETKPAQATKKETPPRQPFK